MDEGAYIHDMTRGVAYEANLGEASIIGACGGARHRADLPAADEYLMQGVAQGDAAAFAQLIGRHMPSVYRLCRRMVDDCHEAEDLTQESFVRLWQCAPGWRPAGAGLPAWLHRVGTNLCLDRLRTRREIATGELPDLEDGLPDAIQRILASELEQHLSGCLRRLPGPHRTALVLTYYEGHSNGSAARMMDMKLKAFESLLLRARRRMSTELRLAGIAGEDIQVLA